MYDLSENVFCPKCGNKMLRKGDPHPYTHLVECASCKSLWDIDFFEEEEGLLSSYVECIRAVKKE